MQLFKKKRNKGFTLVELVVVILVIAILATATFLGGATVIKQARKSKVQTNLSNYATYVQDMFYAEPGVANYEDIDGNKTAIEQAKELLNSKYLTRDFQLGETKDSWNKLYEFYFSTGTVNQHKCTYVIISSNGSNGTKESYEAVYDLVATDHISAQAALNDANLATGDDLGLVVLLRDGVISSANYGFDKASAAPTAITMLDGVNQTYNGTSLLTFRSSANIHTFQEVRIDGEVVAPTNYTVTEGSTIITFKETYAKILATGNHDIEIISAGGTAETNFEVKLACIVTFDANGGTVSPENKAVNYNTVYGELPVPIKDGCEFKGWYTALDSGTKIDSTTIINNTDHTLYAHWGLPAGLYKTGTTTLLKTWEQFKNENKAAFPSQGHITGNSSGNNFTSRDVSGDLIIGNDITCIDKNAFSRCTNLTSIIIPDSVTSISFNTFQYCTNLTSVSLPKNLKTISGNMFEGCKKLSSIIIPKGVTSIGDYAFASCEALSAIDIPEGVTSIGAYAFEYDVKINTIVLPNGVTIIDYGAFYHTCIKNVTIPITVKEIESNILTGSYITITYLGTKSQWNSIRKNSDWFYTYNCSNNIIHCTDGDIIIK